MLNDAAQILNASVGNDFQKRRTYVHRDGDD